jgi:hypothetical protein
MMHAYELCLNCGVVTFTLVSAELHRSAQAKKVGISEVPADVWQAQPTWSFQDLRLTPPLHQRQTA